MLFTINIVARSLSGSSNSFWIWSAVDLSESAIFFKSILSNEKNAVSEAEIKDEFDDDENDDYTILGDGKYIFDGKIPLLDMYRILDVEGEDFEEIKGEAETIAGLILEIKGGFPRKGEIITLKNYEFTVEHIDRRRIHRIKLEVK